MQLYSAVSGAASADQLPSTCAVWLLCPDPSATDLPMPGVHSSILARVVEYMQYHKGVEPPPPEKPLRSRSMRDVCKDPWDADFMDRIGEQRQLLYDVILAANYMDIKTLLNLGCAKVGTIIKGEPLERVKDKLATGTKTDDGAAKKEDKKITPA